jgi:hypothetical protein
MDRFGVHKRMVMGLLALWSRKHFVTIGNRDGRWRFVGNGNAVYFTGSRSYVYVLIARHALGHTERSWASFSDSNWSA